MRKASLWNGWWHIRRDPTLNGLNMQQSSHYSKDPGGSNSCLAWGRAQARITQSQANTAGYSPWLYSSGENHPWEKDWHGSCWQAMEVRASFLARFSMNYLQASSSPSLDSVPTPMWVMLEYNIGSSAQVNSELACISNSRRNCWEDRGWCCIRWTEQAYPYLTPGWDAWCVRGLPAHMDMNTWRAEYNDPLQWQSTVPAQAGRLSKHMS